MLLLSNRLMQQSGVNTLVPVYVVGVFTGDKMIAEGKVLADSTDVCTTFVYFITWYIKIPYFQTAKTQELL